MTLSGDIFTIGISIKTCTSFKIEYQMHVII